MWVEMYSRKCVVAFLVVALFVIVMVLFQTRDLSVWLMIDSSSRSYYDPLNVTEGCILSFLVVNGLTRYLSLPNESYPFYRSFHKAPLNYDNLGKECASKFYQGQQDTTMEPFLLSCFYPFKISANQRQKLQQTLGLIKRVFQESQTELVLTGGSFLGSWRYHGMIPYDDDIDFYILRHQKLGARYLLESLSKNKTNQCVFRDTEETNQHWKLGVVCEGPRNKDCLLDVDFFFMWRDDGGILKFLEKPGTFRVTDYYPLRQRPFENVMFDSPRDFEAYMNRQYPASPSHMCQFKNHDESSSSGSCTRSMVPCDSLKFMYPYKVSGLIGNRSVELIVDKMAVTSVFISGN